jgi:predicted AlkP superfamily pyrophosphatase or phosphodiesterase
MRYLLAKMRSPSIDWFMASIPDDLMPYFTRITPEVTCDEEINGVATLFHILKQNDVESRYHEIRDYQIPDIEFAGRDSFTVFFIPQFDAIGHRHGPASTEISREVTELDRFIQSVMATFDGVEQLHLLVFSDHGMAEIKGKVDVKRAIDQLPLTQPDDYLAFYDSTLARFWFFTDEAQRLINETLRSLEQGQVLSRTEQVELGIDFQHNRYGDTHFVIDPGYEIFPNYFVGYLPKLFEQKIRPRKGMHGYNPQHPSQHGVFLYHGAGAPTLSRHTKVAIVDITPFILGLFGLEKPAYSHSSL